MKKRLIINIGSVLLLVILSLALVGCNNNIPKGEYDIGNSFPSVKGKYKLNKTQSAVAMYETGLKNYDYLDYVGMFQAGNIKNDKSGLYATHLYLTSNRIKYSDEDYVGHYLDSYTQKIKCFLDVAIMEEAVVEDGEYRMRKAKKISVDDDNVMEAKEWGEVEYFNKVSDAVKAYPNDPTKMNMFLVKANTVQSSTDPVYDAKNKTYSYTLELNARESTKDYVPVMEYNTKAQGFDAKNLKFNSVTMEVVMWNNGLFKSITTKEVYSASIMGIQMTLTNDLTNYYTYDEEELPYFNMINFY